jgi:hypothetical protein
LSGVVVAVEGPGRSGVGQDLPSGLCVWRATADRCGAGWRPVDRGAGWPGRGYPRPPQHRCARARPGPRAPQSSRAGRRGRGAGRGRWSEKPVQERDQGDDASLDQEGIPDPDEEVASVDDSGVAGPWLQHWVPPPGCRRPLGLVFTQLLRSGTGSPFPSGLGPAGTANANGRGDIRRPPHRSGRWGGPPCARPGPGVVPSASSNPQPSRTQPRCRPADGGRPSLGRVKTPGR